MHRINRTVAHILTIGNGFDLNLGLPTSYSDFVKSADFDTLLNDENHFAKYLKDKHNLQNWIDVENELTIYSASRLSVSPEVFEAEFTSLSNALKSYLCKIDYSKINTNSHAYKLLESTLSKDILILDFNYTNTTRLILEKLGLENALVQEKFIKVHGSLDEGQIIFGVEDNAAITDHHVFLRKAYSSNFRAVNVSQLMISASEVHIFGHSLGKTDFSYFKNFFQTFSSDGNYANGRTINLFYFGNEAYRQLHMQIDELTSRRLTVFKQNIRFNSIDTSKDLLNN